MALKGWEAAEKALKNLPPLLSDDDLTAKKFYKEHRKELISVVEAKRFLEALADEGIYERVQCRTGHGGSCEIAYRTNKSSHRHRGPRSATRAAEVSEKNS